MDETLALYMETHYDAVLTITNDSETVFVELKNGEDVVFRAGAPIGEPGVHDREIAAAKKIAKLMPAAALTIANDAYGDGGFGT